MEEGVSKLKGPAASFQMTGTLPDEVALRGQIVTTRQHKIIQTLAAAMLGMALAGFCYALVFKTTKSRLLFEHTHVQAINVGFATIHMIVLSSSLAMFVYNLILVHKAQLKWTRRKRTICYLAMSQLTVQVINSVFFLVPNVHSIAVRCSWSMDIEFASGFVRWTCWNSLFLLLTIQAHCISPATDKEGNLRRRPIEGTACPLLVMDTTFWLHLPKLIIWVCFEFCIVYLACAYPDNFDFDIVRLPDQGTAPCNRSRYRCKPGLAYKVLTSLWILFLLLYVVIIHAYIRQTRQRLLLAPYKDFIQVHLMVIRLKTQIWFLTVLGVFMVPILWYTRWERCNNYFVAWLGLLPFQVIATSVVFINAFYFMPMPPGDDSIQQAWLQEFVWLEKGYGKALQKRANYNPVKSDILLKEPLFCFETSIKLLLWSELVYYDFSVPRELQRRKRDPGANPKSNEGPCSCLAFLLAQTTKKEEVCVPIDSAPIDSTQELHAGLTENHSGDLNPTDSENSTKRSLAESVDCHFLLEVAMEMYDLKEWEVIHEVQLETRVLLAWSDSTIVVAFRGTAGMANIWSDAKAWRTIHPPRRGKRILGRQPRVHKGFLATWTVNDLDKRVIERIKGIVEGSKTPAEDFKLYLTGHSLGGALATLAAIDLQRACNFPNLYVYTFGAPRTGNHAFAKEYEALAPHTWHIINDRDAVPRSGKFWILYKRPGQRTLINQMGDLRVRPAVLEVCLHQAGFSLKQHYMASYLRALWSICVAQCIDSKRLPGGRLAIETLAASPQMQAYFGTLGLDLEELAQTPTDRVVLPSLVSKQAKLHGMCDFGFLDWLTDILEDIVPITDSAAATLSLIGAEGQDGHHPEETDSGHLATRLSAMNVQRRLSSLAGMTISRSSVLGSESESSRRIRAAAGANPEVTVVARGSSVRGRTRPVFESPWEEREPLSAPNDS